MFNETAILLALSTTSTNRIPLNYSVTIDFPNKKKKNYFATISHTRNNYTRPFPITTIRRMKKFTRSIFGPTAVN